MKKIKDYKKFAKHKYLEYIRDFSSLGNPIILILLSLIVFGLQKEFLLLCIMLAINELFCAIIKFLFHKKRPNNQKYSNILEKIDSGSFPSIHSSRVMIVFLAIYFYSTILLIKTIVVLLILFIGYTRVFLRKHYVVDVVCGYLIGALIYWWINTMLII